MTARARSRSSPPVRPRTITSEKLTRLVHGGNTISTPATVAQSSITGGVGIAEGPTSPLAIGAAGTYADGSESAGGGESVPHAAIAHTAANA